MNVSTLTQIMLTKYFCHLNPTKLYQFRLPWYNTMSKSNHTTATRLFSCSGGHGTTPKWQHHFVWFGAPYSFWVQHHCHKYKSEVCSNLSDLMYVTTNKTHYIIALLYVEKLYVEVNVSCNAVILPSHWSYMQKQVMEGLRQRHRSLSY